MLCVRTDRTINHRQFFFGGGRRVHTPQKYLSENFPTHLEKFAPPPPARNLNAYWIIDSSVTE